MTGRRRRGASTPAARRLAESHPLLGAMLFAPAAIAAPEPPEAVSGSPAPVVTIGAVRLSSPSASERRVVEALGRLEKAFSDRGWRTDVRRLATDEPGKAVSEQSVDIFVSSGGLYRSLIPHGARDIATLFDPRSSPINQGIGSSFVVRADREELRHVEDLRGGTVVVSFPNAFTGNAYAMGEVAFSPSARENGLSGP